NRIDGEFVGISKISNDVYQLMLDEFQENQNPFVNYEYLLLDVSRQYHIGYLKINDLIWSDIDSKEHYIHILNTIYPRLKRKEEEYFVDQLKEIATGALKIEPQSIANIVPLGGMTNKNYRLRLTDGREYVMRIPGAGTEVMINRENEGKNLQVINKLGID